MYQTARKQLQRLKAENNNADIRVKYTPQLKLIFETQADRGGIICPKPKKSQPSFLKKATNINTGTSAWPIARGDQIHSLASAKIIKCRQGAGATKGAAPQNIYDILKNLDEKTFRRITKLPSKYFRTLKNYSTVSTKNENPKEIVQLLTVLFPFL